MSALERAQRVAQLEHAVTSMAGRYGLSCMRQGHARITSPEYGRADRAASRQLRALYRITAALAALAAEVDR